MTDTRTTYLRLQSPRLHIFCEALEKKILEGWEIAIPAKQGGTMFSITLSKEVPVDSSLPLRASWNCKAEFEAQVLQEVDLPQNEVQELPEAPYPPLDTLELIPATNIDLNEELNLSNSSLSVAVDGNIAQISQEGEVVATYDLTNPQDDVTLEVTVSDNINTPTTEVKLAKSESGFIIKEYTLEEVQKLNWQQLSKLAADLGCATGNKVEREAAVVEQSKVQWGNL